MDADSTARKDAMNPPKTDRVREAMLYARRDDDRVECRLCAHRCRIAPGKRGICTVRENRGGTLHTLVYGLLVAANVDPIEKKPLYHVQPGTQSYSIATPGCNFRCVFCQNADISQLIGPDALPDRTVSPEAVVEAAVRSHCASIAYTYTEPTIFFEFAHDTARLAHERGLKNVFVTNGYQTPETLDAMAGLIDAANVDLKSFSDDFYRRECGARLAPVLETLRGMRERGIFIEVTTLLIPGENDSPEEIRQIAEFVAGLSPDVPWHVSAFHPTFKKTDRPRTRRDAIYRALEIGREVGLNFLYAGNVPGGGYEDTHCPRCGEVVIGRRGYLIGPVHLEGAACAHCGHPLPLVL